VLRDSENNVNVIRAQGKDMDWTIVRFPTLTHGPRTGTYRVGYVGKNSGSRISRADAADFIVKELAK
jgi:putative NADH-flavin reductase